MTELLDRLKETAQEAATRAKEGIEELRLKHELGKLYGEIGRKAVQLVESGEVKHPALAEGVEKAQGLKAQLEALATPAEPEPAAEQPAEPAAAEQPAEEPVETTS